MENVNIYSPLWIFLILPHVQLSHHLESECPLQLHPCPFSWCGCPFQVGKSLSSQVGGEKVSQHFFVVWTQKFHKTINKAVYMYRLRYGNY